MSSKPTSNPLTLLAGIGIGAAIAYFTDAGRGARRRHVAADKTKSALRDAKRDLRDAAVNAKNHAAGAITEARLRKTEESVDDERLVERVRAELGHHVEHPRAIEVFAENGCVRLCGAVPADEIETAVKTAAGVRGVQGVENQLMAC